MTLESLSPFIIAAITALSALGGVALTQRSARKSVKAQVDATALLDRERRTDEASREMQRHERTADTARRTERLEAYIDFLASSDQLRYVSVPTVTFEAVTEVVERFSRAEFRLLLVAPDNIAKAALLVSASARKLPNVQDRKKSEESMRRTTNLFIREVRLDLGIEGDLIGWIDRAGKNESEAQ